ncbi:siderophore-interacting protein [Williamsia sp.]|uniref:siderophore-interacting protein n=1 Tax=Williamsia sp. TaxID=1872085 RepID=UPI002F946A80
MARGFQGLALKAFGANDYKLTVTGARAVTESFRRLSFQAGGLLEHHESHPTQWIRLWIPNGDKVQQRGYTLLNSDPVADTFDIDFALHPGPAWTWASTASAGDVMEASVLGSKFGMPDPVPTEYLLFGDAASIPAINTLLAEVGDARLRAAAAELTTTADTYAWVACDFGTTRNIVKSLKTIHGLPKNSIKATAYWK